MFEEARNSINQTTRRGLALYFGTVNLAGETVTNPSKILRGIERRGERVLKQIESNNKQIRRSVTLLQRRTTETANSVRGTARATVGLASSLADDATAPAPSKRKSTSRKRSTGRTRVAAAGRTVTGTRRSTSTRSTAATRTAKQRSQAAEKAARTRALNERKAELKKSRTVARAKATRAKNETKTTLDKAQDSVQHGLQAMGQRLENVGERIERSVEQVAS